jgi:hypothetical protein
MIVMQKEHDVPMVGRHGEKTTRMVVEKDYTGLRWNRMYNILCQLSKHEIYI